MQPLPSSSKMRWIIALAGGCLALCVIASLAVLGGVYLAARGRETPTAPAQPTGLAQPGALITPANVDRLRVLREIGSAQGISAFAWQPDSSLFASSGRGADVILWDPLSGRALRTLHAQGEYVASVVFSPDGSVLAVGSQVFYRSATLTLWDAKSGDLLRSITWAAGSQSVGSLTNVVFSPDGSQVAAGMSASTARRWNTATGEQLPLPGTPAGPIAFTPDGKYLLAGHHGVEVWDLASGALVRTLNGQTVPAGQPIDKLVLSRDGSLIAAAHQSNLSLWDLESGERLATIPNYRFGGVPSLAISPDGALVVSGEGLGFERASPNRIRVWDVEGARELPMLETHKSVVTGLAFSPDGRWLVSASEDGAVLLWGVSP